MLQLNGLMIGAFLEKLQNKSAWFVPFVCQYSHLSFRYFPKCLISFDDFNQRNDFWNEAIKLADLHHPNVVAFYGVVLDGPGGSVATVTEYMVNGSLRNALQKNEKYVLFHLQFMNLHFKSVLLWKLYKVDKK